MPTQANTMTLGNIGPLLDKQVIHASAPCRIDFGGTLDISSFHYPLRHLSPSTVNMALDRRTTVSLRPAAGPQSADNVSGFSRRGIPSCVCAL
jgi:hypothetical protein